jgi:hypothetical protein
MTHLSYSPGFDRSNNCWSRNYETPCFIIFSIRLLLPSSWVKLSSSFSSHTPSISVILPPFDYYCLPHGSNCPRHLALTRLQSLLFFPCNQRPRYAAVQNKRQKYNHIYALSIWKYICTSNF